MKYIFQFIITASLLFFLSACSRDNNNVLPSNALTSIISQSNWIISTFSIDGNDRLYLFGGYRFTFSGNGTVNAARGNGAAAQGTWNSGSANGKSSLYLDFSSSPTFNQLNGSWETIELTSGYFRLQKGTSGNDLLSFEAN